MVRSSKVAAILAPEWALMRCPKDDAKERNMPVDITRRSIVITGSGHVILSAVQVEKLA